MTQPSDAKLPLPLDLDTAPKPAVRRWFYKRYLLVLVIPVAMFTGAVVGLYFQPPGLQKFYQLTGLQPGGGSSSPIALPPDIALPPQMAETLLPSDVIGLARIMPRGDVSVVAAPYGAGDARVMEILVAVGERVARGAVLARLDNQDSLDSALLLAEANLSVREAILAQTQAGIMASRAEAQAVLDQARATATETTTALIRTQELVQRGVATVAVLETAQTAAENAAQAVARAEATLTRFVAVALDQQPDIMVATRNVAAAQADLARARMDLSRAKVVAPITGTILDIRATPGQRPPVDGIMDMGNIDQMMAEVEIWQDRIAVVQPGQPVELIALALPRPLRGQVERVGLTVGRQGLISNDAAANADARVIRVLVTLDDASSALAARFTGLEAVARIDTTAAQRAVK